MQKYQQHDKKIRLVDLDIVTSYRCIFCCMYKQGQQGPQKLSSLKSLKNHPPKIHETIINSFLIKFWVSKL